MGAKLTKIGIGTMIFGGIIASLSLGAVAIGNHLEVDSPSWPTINKFWWACPLSIAVLGVIIYFVGYAVSRGTNTPA